ncbi:MAG: glycosyltransferase [Solirubrobacterales bacterium]
MAAADGRIPVLYLAPWVDIGGTDKNTIDWFRAIDRERFAPSLIATQPSANRRLDEIAEFAEEIWVLPDVMPADRMPAFILDFIHSRGVRALHLMNSRLGFDLLPDLTCLPNPPGIVVQLHVEEADRSGYVRYVTTRFGNLVDRFSVSHEHLAEAVHEYGIPRDKIRVIYIGVDAEEEFSPERVEPVGGLDRKRLQILFPSRLVEQKDPLLMVEVAAALRERGVDFQIQVLGEGDLEEDVRRRAAELDLGDAIAINPPTPTPQAWYAACDAMLMTSVYEGVPASVYEAMAMGVPVVAPTLPGNVELLGEDHDGLVEPRDSVEGYAVALARLAAASDDGSSGPRLRERARERFSLERMAAEHGELYDEVAPDSAPPEELERAPEREPIRFPDRPTGTPLVSVLIPHFNQAAFIGECIESIRAQTYPRLETIVVDDASSEAEAQAAIAALERADDVTVVRQSENGGPSRARNAGLEHCSGAYILPVDSDNVLLPDAVEKLVAQLAAAPEDVGFVYPNLQFFGNREDYYEVPSYNLYDLTRGNCCDTCSLLDRRIFDAGERYREEIRLGHEDWEFVLRLAARGVRGEAATGPTVRYRKWGFNRSDSVEHAPEEFEELLAEISPFKGREAELKSLERPALSILPLEQIDPASEAGREIAARLAAQQCIDAELIAGYAGEWPAAAAVPPARRNPAGPAAGPLEALRGGLSLARGRFVAVTAGAAGDLLANPGFVERVLRRFDASGDELDAIAFVDAGPAGRFRFRALAERDCAPDTAPHTIVWRRAFEQRLPRGLHADPTDPVGSLARLICAAGAWVERRHLATPGRSPRQRPAQVAWQPLGEIEPRDPRSLRVDPPPLLPGAGEYRVPRWEVSPTWTPPMSTLAIRYREKFGEGRLVTSAGAPAGYVPEHHLGTLRNTSLEGTARLVRGGDGYEVLPRGEWDAAGEDAEVIGYAESAQLPGMEPVALAVHRETGQRTLVTPAEDPLLAEVDVIGTLGCLDPFPLKPRETPDAAPPWGLVGLTKAVDQGSRRHRYAAGAIAAGEPIGELGALAESDLGGSIAAWIVDDRLVTEAHNPRPHRPGIAAAARWSAEPAAWRGLAPRSAQAKAIARRSLATAGRLVRPARAGDAPGGAPAGWLFGSHRPGRAPLFAAYHPVTGDQLLSRSPQDAPQMGYGSPQLLGFLRLAAPLTGDLTQSPLPVPWARRFGAVPRAS